MTGEAPRGLRHGLSALGLADWARSARLVAGAMVIGLAATSVVTAASPAELLAWVGVLFGPGFAILYVGLLIAALFVWRQHRSAPDARIWTEAGLQIGAGIGTLAMTFTLLGLSLGIGTLAATPLTPEAVPDVLATLTEKFRLAFLTTVVGLPTAAVVRGAFSISRAGVADRARLDLTQL